jgi:hypothetical protein
MWTLWMLWLGCQPADKDADPDTAGEGDADVDADADSDADSDADPITIPAGVWGGEHWLLRVGEEVFLETDCAHGWLPAPLQADSRGALQIDFTWVSEGGPVEIDTGAAEEGVPATLEAVVAATVIEGTVAIPSLSATVPLRVELGAEPFLTKCL